MREFDRYRAPLSAEDRARRELGQLLSEPEREHLERWGYPYVLDRFRFHMTLTGPLERAGARTRSRPSCRRPWRSHLAEPVPIDQLALFTQTHRVAPFRVVARFPFGA